MNPDPQAGLGNFCSVTRSTRLAIVNSIAHINEGQERNKRGRDGGRAGERGLGRKG